MFIDNVELRTFLSQFAFCPARRGFMGIERERFLVDCKGRLVPWAKEFLDHIADDRWTYELSACQVEDRTRPVRSMKEIRRELVDNDVAGRHAAEKLGLRLAAIEVAPSDMPLTVYPDARYQRIAAVIPRERLIAACRVTGTHIHVGVGSVEEALAAYGAIRSHLDRLCLLGDHSAGERLRLYKEMTINWEPPAYASVEEFFKTAEDHCFKDDPRSCWHLIRISKHGTVELRMFGAARSVEEVLSWVLCIKGILGKEIK